MTITTDKRTTNDLHRKLKIELHETR